MVVFLSNSVPHMIQCVELAVERCLKFTGGAEVRRASLPLDQHRHRSPPLPRVIARASNREPIPNSSDRRRSARFFE